MFFRDTEIYIGGKTKRRLKWICKATGSEITEHELADKVINEWVETTYPQIIPIEEKLKLHEKEFSDSFPKPA